MNARPEPRDHLRTLFGPSRYQPSRPRGELGLVVGFALACLLAAALILAFPATAHGQPPTIITPANAQAALDAAGGPGTGPGYTVRLTTPGDYGDLKFNHAMPCTLVGAPGVTVRSITWAGGEARGYHQIRQVAFEGGAGVAITMLDDVSNVLVQDCTVGPGYRTAVSIERADKRWPQPRMIRINGLWARGMTSLGMIVGAADSVSLEGIMLDCRLCQGGNGAYLHDRQNTNLLCRDFMVLGADGIPACGIRGAAVKNERIIAEGCLVNFASGHNVQSITGLVSINAKRYELEAGDFGPLYIVGARLRNTLTADKLDQGGPGHHNINIGGGLLSRIEIRGSYAYTAAAQSGTCWASSSFPSYGGVVELGMLQSRGGSPIEWGADVSAAYTFLTPPGGVGAPDGRTVADYAREHGMTLEQLWTRKVPVREIHEWLAGE